MPQAPAREERRARLALAAVGALLLAWSAATVPLMAWREGPPADRVGACGVGPNCRDSGCHQTYLVGSTTLTYDLHLDGAPGGPLPGHYLPGRLYALRLDVTDTDPNAAAWGFELSPLRACQPGVLAGSMTPAAADASRTRVISAAGIDYLEHQCLCVTQDPSCCGYVPQPGPGMNQWSFTWTAPPRGSGDVTFYMAFNAANWDGTPQFDRISLGSVPIAECPTIGDLRVRKDACDATQPGVDHVDLSWTPSGMATADVVRSTTDRAQLAADPSTWTLQPSSCIPLDGAPVTYFSIGSPCEPGVEWH